MLTVLLATRNRAEILRDVLECYCQLLQPSGGWKLVVIDNGSTDLTAQVVSSFAQRITAQYLFEPKLGKNFALNAGLGLLEGDLAVLADDDAFPYPDWLVQLRRAADTQLAYSLFGGAILPRWEVPPPAWVRWVDPGPVYTLTDPELKEGPIPPYFVFGPNMAIRTVIFQSGMRLDPSIGPRGSSYPMGSETELVMRLSRQGHKAWHVTGATVEHLIREAQLTESWVRQRAVRYGRGYYRIFLLQQNPSQKLWMGVPRHLFRDIPKEALAVGGALLSRNHERVFRSSWRFNFLRGQAIEGRILARQRNAQSTRAGSGGDHGDTEWQNSG